MLQSLSTDVAIGFYGCCIVPTDVASMFFECWSTRGSNVAVVLYGCCKPSLPMLQSFSTDAASILFECCNLQFSYVAIVTPRD
jgi:hypothetical protein